MVLPNKGFMAQLNKYNKFQKLTEEMVEKEEEVEEKEEERVKDATNEGKKENKENIDEVDYDSYAVNGGVPAIYTCTHGQCTYLHGNMFTGTFSHPSPFSFLLLLFSPPPFTSPSFYPTSVTPPPSLTNTLFPSSFSFSSFVFFFGRCFG